VKKAYWHKGIGKKMMQACIDWCKEKGVEQLELDVVTENERAIALYQSLGFQIYGTKKHALKYSDQTYADEYYMILMLEG
jgi:ribosomal protein S18 acetylase RimI-like enzyme